MLNNKQFHKFVTDGIEIQTQGTDGYNPTVSVYIFDFENPKNNDFMAVNQFTIIEGQMNKRPDIILFVNGLPLVVIELKMQQMKMLILLMLIINYKLINMRYQHYSVTMPF